MTTIYIECSTTINSNFCTGIQRVVRCILEHSDLVADELNIKCVPVVLRGGRLFLVPIKSQRGESFLLKLIKLKIKIKSLYPKILYKPFYFIVTPIYSFILNSIGRYRLQEVGADLEITSEFIKKSGDTDNILLLLDSTWLNSIWPAVDKFRSGGGRVTAVLYDLIPFTHPDTVEEITRSHHTSFWLKVPEHVDSVICISKTVRQQFIEWQDQQKLKRKIAADKVKWFYLGAELSSEDPVINVLGSALPSFLMVGSVEPRKNHQFVLDVFDQLWADGLAVQLVIVGCNGWKSEQLIKRIEGHAEYNKKLYLIRNASDRDLMGLYNHSNALIMSSIAEGFGLPIVEAMERDIDVICSDIPVFREVGGEWPTYFSLDDKNSLAKAIQNKLTSNENKRASGKQSEKWMTWKESTLMLLRKVSFNESE